MRTLTLATAGLLLCGCDWILQVDAEVTVDPSAQQAIGTWPQQVLLSHGVLDQDTGPAGVRRLAVLCDPSPTPVVTTWHFARVNGCGEPAAITAWLEPLGPDAGLACGPRGREGEAVDPSRTPPAGAPSATTRVFDGGGSCPRGAITIGLSITAPSP